jgi:lysozyme
MRRTNQAGIDLIKASESLRLTSYLCPAGKWTIGYGHTGDVSPGQKITEHQADAILAHDLERTESAVDALCPATATDNQFSALVSFAFNTGAPALQGSTLLRKFVSGDVRGAADEFLKWNKAHVGGQLMALSGLTERRRAERDLFLRA